VSVPHLKMPPEAGRQTYPFVLDDLPFAYDALEPHFDQKTLQLHHRGHHAVYVKKLNEALARYADLHRLTLAELLRDPARVPADIRTAVKNNGGGHLNHDFFWSMLAPSPDLAPTGKLAEAMNRQFGGFEEFCKKFTDVAEKHFASGWVALALDHATQQLEVVDLKDHEVLAAGKSGLLILDIWEHAYYLKYQNRRAEFIHAFWNVVNWARVEATFDLASAR